MVTLLFSHFGRKIPKHLEANLRRTASLFPHHKIVLVSDSKARVGEIPDRVEVVSANELSWMSGRQLIDQDMRFWNGWWQKTFDRLYLIKSVHDLYPKEPILQIESDCILFPSFPFQLLASKNKLGWPGYSDEMDVASIIYSHSKDLTEAFHASLISTIREDRKVTDMTVLRKIRMDLGEDVFLLPEFIESGSPVVSQEDVEMGLFDGLSHGNWICGRDPRAHWGLGQRNNKTPNSENQKMPTYFMDDGQLYSITEKIQIPINNLHVHSKELFFFAPEQENKALSVLFQVNSNIERDHKSHYFVFSAFLFCLNSNLRIWSSSVLSLLAWRRLLLRIVKRTPSS